MYILTYIPHTHTHTHACEREKARESMWCVCFLARVCMYLCMYACMQVSMYVVREYHTDPEEGLGQDATNPT